MAYPWSNPSDSGRIIDLGFAVAALDRIARYDRDAMLSSDFPSDVRALSDEAPPVPPRQSTVSLRSSQADTVIIGQIRSFE